MLWIVQPWNYKHREQKKTSLLGVVMTSISKKCPPGIGYSLKCKSWYGLSLVAYFWAGFIPGTSLRGCMLHKRKKIQDFQPCIKNWNLSFYEESRKMWRSPYQPRYWFFQIECHCYGESKNGKVTIGLLYSPSSAPLFPYHWNMICVSIICIIKQSAAD